MRKRNIDQIIDDFTTLCCGVEAELVSRNNYKCSNCGEDVTNEFYATIDSLV